MKNILKSLLLCVILCVFMSNKINLTFADGVSEAIVDINSGRILHEVNANEKKHIASLTKVVSCITAIENSDLDKVVTINKKWTGIEGSSIYLREGEQFTIKELLYGLMLRSGNDCAASIANACLGSYNAFIKAMNDYALKSGAVNSNFVNPHGLDSVEHYSTARDMALITATAMKNNIFSDIVKTKKITIGKGESARLLINKNKLLSNYSYATGVKTGYTKTAGRCFIGACEKNGFALVVVLLNCPPMFERCEQLMNEMYSQYKNKIIVSKDKSVCSYCDGKNIIPCYVKEDIFYPIKNGEEMDITIQPYFYENIKQPVSFSQEMGTIKIFNKKHLLFEEKIYNIII